MIQRTMESSYNFIGHTSLIKMSKPYLTCKAHFNQKDKKYIDISMYTFCTCIAKDVNLF